MYWGGTSSGKSVCSSDRCAVVTHLSKQLCVLKESVMSFAAGTCVPQLGSQSLRSQLLRGVESDWHGSVGESRRKRLVYETRQCLDSSFIPLESKSVSPVHPQRNGCVLRSV